MASGHEYSVIYTNPASKKFHLPQNHLRKFFIYRKFLSTIEHHPPKVRFIEILLPRKSLIHKKLHTSEYSLHKKLHLPKSSSAINSWSKNFIH